MNVMPVRVPTGVRHFIQGVDVRSRFGMAGSMSYPSRNVEVLFCTFNQLSLEEVLVITGGARFWLRNGFHVEVEPQDFGRAYFREAHKANEHHHPNENCRLDPSG